MSEQVSPDRWFLSDVDGRMEIWREAVLLDITRDEHGEIDSYRTPVSWAPGDLILYRDLETWNEGEDAADDARRTVAARIVADHNEVERLRTELDADRAVGHGAKHWHDTYQDAANAYDEFLGVLLDLLPGAADEGMDAYDQIPRGIEKLAAERDEARAAQQRSDELLVDAHNDLCEALGVRHRPLLDVIQHAATIRAEVERLRAERTRAVDALSDVGRTAEAARGDLEDGINAELLAADITLATAEGAVKRVRDLHRPVAAFEGDPDDDDNLTTVCACCGVLYPCSTVRALDGGEQRG